MLPNFIQLNLPKAVVLLEKHKVIRAYLFGSTADGLHRADSDVDVLIEFSDILFDNYAENFWSLEAELAHLFQRKVDLIPSHTLKNPYFIKAINRQKKLIYERESEEIPV
jgi:uncharacterized protein